MAEAIASFMFLLNTALVPVLIIRRAPSLLCLMQCLFYWETFILIIVKIRFPEHYRVLWLSTYILEVAGLGIAAAACTRCAVPWINVCKWLMLCELPLRFMAWDRFRSPREFVPTLPYYLYVTIDLAWTLLMLWAFYTHPHDRLRGSQTRPSEAGRRSRHALATSIRSGPTSQQALAWWGGRLRQAAPYARACRM